MIDSFLSFLENVIVSFSAAPLPVLTGDRYPESKTGFAGKIKTPLSYLLNRTGDKILCGATYLYALAYTQPCTIIHVPL